MCVCWSLCSASQEVTEKEMTRDTKSLYFTDLSYTIYTLRKSKQNGWKEEKQTKIFLEIILL